MAFQSNYFILVFAIFKVFLFLLNGVRGEETKKTSSCPAAFIHTYLLKTMKNLSVKTILILFFLSFRYSSVSNRLNNKVSERCVCELLLLEVNRNLFLFAFSSNSDTFIKNSRSRLVYFFCRLPVPKFGDFFQYMHVCINLFKNLLKIWKSANIFVFIWKYCIEDFTLKRLLLFEICEREIREKFVYKYSETTEYVKNYPTF